MQDGSATRIILVDPDDAKRRTLQGRLRSQGYDVEALDDPAEAATLALSDTPAALIADLWMPRISGVQLCRLLTSEPSTAMMPIVLRAEGNAPRDRFWAEKAGAAAYVAKGRIGELVRALSRAIQQAPQDDDFFTHLEEEVDIRDRIARQLDQALYESVLAAEVRALSNCENFDRLFDLFSQFVCQVASYRWLAVHVPETGRFGLHCHPRHRVHCEMEARDALAVGDAVPTVLEDEDALHREGDHPSITSDIVFGAKTIGRVAMGCGAERQEDEALMRLLATELGGPLRMSALVEESRRLALYDPLTGIMNRRAFSTALEDVLQRAAAEATEVALVLLDVDHFKAINDQRGHAVGDLVLETLGTHLARFAGAEDHIARWGGEEFVLAMSRTSAERARERAEQLRNSIAELDILAPDGGPVRITASLGLGSWRRGEHSDALVERADKAMYQAKVSGRNRVVTDTERAADGPSASAAREPLEAAAVSALGDS